MDIRGKLVGSGITLAVIAAGVIAATNVSASEPPIQPASLVEVEKSAVPTPEAEPTVTPEPAVTPEPVVEVVVPEPEPVVAPEPEPAPVVEPEPVVEEPVVEAPVASDPGRQDAPPAPLDIGPPPAPIEDGFASGRG